MALSCQAMALCQASTRVSSGSRGRAVMTVVPKVATTPHLWHSYS